MNRNNIRSPNNFIVYWFLLIGLAVFSFIFPVNANAYQGKGNTIDDSVDLSNYYYYEFPYSYSGDPQYCYSDPIRLVPFSLSGNDGSSVYIYVDGVYSYRSNLASKIQFTKNGNYSISSYDMDYAPAFNVSVYNEDEKNDYSFTSRYTQIYGFYVPKLFSEGDNSFGFSPSFDINNLNDYPLDTICVTSPVSESDIKTNGNYIDIVVKGKIGINFSESLLGNSLFPMTSEWLGKFIRKDFRYSLDGDVEDEDNLTYFGLGNKGFNNYLIEYLNQFYQDVSLNIDKNKVGDVNTVWTIGVSGNMNDWSNKHYYNFVLNTRLWCGYLNKDLKYNLSFTVPVSFSGGLTDVMPSEYKTISLQYNISRIFYSDENFDGLDDETTEVIPDSEIEIIHPGFVFPSTSTPSNNNFVDGDVVQNNNNNIVFNNGSDVSKEEQNGILNMLDNCLRTTTGRLKSLGSSLVGFKDNMTGLFSFLPEDIVNLLCLGISLTVVFFILGLRR